MSASEKAQDAGNKANEAASKAGEAAREAGSAAKDAAKDAGAAAKGAAQDAKSTLLQKLQEDGVENPAGFALLGFSGLFFAAMPVTSWLAQPNGLLEKAVNGVAHGVAWLGTAGATTKVGQTGKIAALSTLYIAVTYAISGAGSAAGADAGTKGGRDNNHPRAQVAGLRGLPLRLYSAHYNLMEMFPGFALTAALTQATAPTDQHLINLLGLHVLAKVFVYYPAYLANVGGPRTLAHVIATASVLSVGLKLAKGALI